jgi:replication factor A1
MTSLTADAIPQMVKDNQSASFSPRIQILKIMTVESPGNKRYRAILSDGNNKAHGMFATQNNIHVESGAVGEMSVIQVKDFMINNVKDKALIIILSFDALQNPGSVIGSPKICDVSTSPKSAANNAFIKPESNNSNTYSNNNNNTHNNPYGSSGSNSNYSRPSAPIMRSNASTKPITPIASLNMYQNKWTIKARVTNKGDIRHWSNAKGEGQLFSIELLDASMDIRATFFKEAVDKFHPMLEMNKIYSLSGGRMKTANMQYNTCKSPFELTFDQNSEIVLEDDTGEISQQSYELKPIRDLENVEPGEHVDIIGVVKMVGEPGTIVSKKSGKELQKCELTVVDDSGAEVACTVWGERAMGAQTEFADFPVVAFRRARVSDYGGRTLSASGGNGININPRIPEADRIQSWWQQGGKDGAGVKKLSSSGGGGAGRFPEFKDRKAISAIKGETMGYGEKPDYVSFKATVNFIKTDKDGGAWYPACKTAEDPCKNRFKVQQGTDGNWFCERCQRTYDSCMYRYIFPATITDGTSTTWVSFFDDQANILLEGMGADELQSIYSDPDKGGQEAYEGFFAKAQYTEWVFTCKVKQETHQEETRIKTSIQSLHPMDYAKEGRSLLTAILAM